MSTKTITATVSCKHCGATVIVEKQGVYDNQNLTGGITTKVCPKCHKTSNYVFEIKNGQFTNLK